MTGVPGQPLAVGVIVKVTVTGAFVVLVSIPLIVPVPSVAAPSLNVTVPVGDPAAGEVTAIVAVNVTD